MALGSPNIVCAFAALLIASYVGANPPYLNCTAGETYPSRCYCGRVGRPSNSTNETLITIEYQGLDRPEFFKKVNISMEEGQESANFQICGIVPCERYNITFKVNGIIKSENIGQPANNESIAKCETSLSTTHGASTFTQGTSTTVLGTSTTVLGTSTTPQGLSTTSGSVGFSPLGGFVYINFATVALQFIASKTV